MIRMAIIDDDNDFCEELKARLCNMNCGYEVDCYNSISSFAVSPVRYHIAFIDIMLKINSGIDFARELLE